jgi:superoxide dismutase, Cu-Zn family
MITPSLRPLATILPLALLFGLAACEAPQTPDYETTDRDTTYQDDGALDQDAPSQFTTDQQVFDAYPGADAVARIEPVGDGNVRGYFAFEQDGETLRMTINLEGLPGNEHAFHVHENGSCEPGADGEPAGAAGGHFAPHGRPHGAPDDDPEQRHVGDFGNLNPDADGTVRMTVTDDVASLEGENSIVGLAVIIHERRDDLETQPTGDAGGRIGCGIVNRRN